MPYWTATSPAFLASAPAIQVCPNGERQSRTPWVPSSNPSGFRAGPPGGCCSGCRSHRQEHFPLIRPDGPTGQHGRGNGGAAGRSMVMDTVVTEARPSKRPDGARTLVSKAASAGVAMRNKPHRPLRPSPWVRARSSLRTLAARSMLCMDFITPAERCVKTGSGPPSRSQRLCLPCS